MRHLIADFDAGPTFGFGEIAINLPQSRFWITSCYADHRDIGFGGELMGRQAVRR
jgi:hypothetical protein